MKDSSGDIARWETRAGLALPVAYRRFMIAFNGGRVYPRLFRYRVPLDRYFFDEPVTFVDPFYAWSSVEQHWRGEVYGQGNPPDMLMIGCNPGGLQILLSLRAADYGQVFCWVHSTNIWGTDGNDRVWFQAPSFEAFLDALYDDPDRSDYEDWHIPLCDKVARPLVF